MPNSEAVVRAALRAACEARAPLLFAAALNQVDRDGGYTGWTPSAFVDFVRDETERLDEMERLDVTVPVLVGLDHGDPWKKDAHLQQEASGEAALAAATRSIVACVEAGYDLLHLDATGTGPCADASPSVDSLVGRTLGLMRRAEAARRDAGLPEALCAALAESGRWRKWLSSSEGTARRERLAFSDLPAARQRWLVDTGSRYVWTGPRVKDARATLRENVSPYRDAEAHVQGRLVAALHRYLRAFALVGLAGRLEAAALEVSP